jgi:hypothetical protein
MVEPTRIGLLLDAGAEDAALLAAVRETTQTGGGGRARLAVDLVLCVGAPREAPASRVAGLVRSLAALAAST